MKNIQEKRIDMKKEIRSESERKNVSFEINEKYVEILKQMIDCKTVFTRDFVNQP